MSLASFLEYLLRCALTMPIGAVARRDSGWFSRGVHEWARRQ
jgi:hypothetical protein